MKWKLFLAILSIHYIKVGVRPNPLEKTESTCGPNIHLFLWIYIHMPKINFIPNFLEISLKRTVGKWASESNSTWKNQWSVTIMDDVNLKKINKQTNKQKTRSTTFYMLPVGQVLISNINYLPRYTKIFLYSSLDALWRYKC